MLRGAIDYISETEIGGWIYCEVGPVKRRLVLAYYEGKCLGSGPIETFRQDLLDAGLGDGVLGFRFPISKIDANELHAVSVKLEGSDLVLVQGRKAERSVSRAGAIPSREHLEWMRSRKWLTQGEFDLLKYLLQAGVYEKLLLAPGQPHVAAQEAKTGLELVCMSDIGLAEETLPAAVDFAGYARHLPETGCPVVALWCPERLDFTVIEGSHRAHSAEWAQREAILHSLGPDRIVFVDVRANAMWRSPRSGHSQIIMFRATLPD